MNEFKKEEKLYNGITNVSDKIIDETKEQLENGSRKNNKTIWIKFGAIAACIAIVLTAIYLPKAKTTKNSISGVLTASPIVDVIYPEAISFDDYDKQFDLREKFPIENNFEKSLKDFSLKTASALMKDGTENINYSPISLYYALAMATNGAEGETEKELLSLLGVSSKEELLNQCKNFYNQSYIENEIGNLKISNSIWLQDGIDFKKEFVESTAENLYASSFNVDFEDKDTGENISNWVNQETKGMIKPEIEVQPQQIMSLINTIYFNDEWQNKFSAEKTTTDKFHLSNGKAIDFDFMNQKDQGVFRRGDGFLTSELFLKNNGSVCFVLPDEGVSPKALAQSPEKLNEALFGGQQHYGEITWKVPKMEISSKLDLKDLMEKLGIKTPFNEKAKFGSITDEEAYISKIDQETKIKLDENGVEAASFTQIGFCGAPAPLISFKSRSSTFSDTTSETRKPQA